MKELRIALFVAAGVFVLVAPSKAQDADGKLPAHFALGVSVDLATPDVSALEPGFQQYDPEFALDPSRMFIELAGGAGWWQGALEFSQLTAHSGFLGETDVKVDNWGLSLWARRAFTVIPNRTWLLAYPAVSIGGGSVIVEMDANDDSPKEVLRSGLQPKFGVGLGAEVRLTAPSVGLGFIAEYRYLWERYDELDTGNGGEVFFDDPTLDLTGSSFLIGVRVYLFREEEGVQK